MHSEILRRFPFFEFVVHTQQPLVEVNKALRDHLMDRISTHRTFETRFYGKVSGGVFRVKVHWIGASAACIGEGECRPTPEGSAINVRVRLSSWWLIGCVLFFIVVLRKELSEGTVRYWGEWIGSSIGVGGLFWAIQIFAGKALVRFIRDSIPNDGFPPKPPNPC
jgi:hypothetical protein